MSQTECILLSRRPNGSIWPEAVFQPPPNCTEVVTARSHNHGAAGLRRPVLARISPLYRRGQAEETFADESLAKTGLIYLSQIASDYPHEENEYDGPQRKGHAGGRDRCWRSVMMRKWHHWFEGLQLQLEE